jgi:hypothetical protein
VDAGRRHAFWSCLALIALVMAIVSCHKIVCEGRENT